MVTQDSDQLSDQVLEEIVSEMLMDDAEPGYILSGSGSGWFLDPMAKEMVRLERGIELVPVTADPDERDRILVRTHTRFLLIPASELQEIGWN